MFGEELHIQMNDGIGRVVLKPYWCYSNGEGDDLSLTKVVMSRNWSVEAELQNLEVAKFSSDEDLDSEHCISISLYTRAEH